MAAGKISPKFLGENEAVVYNSRAEQLEAILEINKCKKDIVYFAEKYCNIKTYKGLHPIKLHKFQKEFLEDQLSIRRNILMCSRQVGKSTIATVVITHYILFNNYKKVAIVSKDKKGAKEILARILLMYKELPKWLQRPVVAEGTEHLVLTEEVSVMPFPAKSDEIRGQSVNYLYLDEFAFLHQNIADNFITGVMPTISNDPTSKVLLTTTPKGKNHFYHRWWSLAKDEVTPEENKLGVYKRRKVVWSDVPREEGEEVFRATSLQSLGGDLQLFRQEFECEFIDGRENSLYRLIEGKNYKKPTYFKSYRLQGVDKTIFNREYSRHSDKCYFYKPRKLLDDLDNIFVAGVDVANGVGEDYSVINVFWLNKTERRYEQFFKYTVNTITPHNFTDILDCILTRILKQRVEWVAIERTGPGIAVIDKLIDKNKFYYEQVLYADKAAAKRGFYGNITSKHSKPARIATIKDLFSKNQIMLYDSETIYEHNNFLLSNGRFIMSEVEIHDDEVSSVWQIADSIEYPEYAKWFTSRPVAPKEVVKQETFEYVSMYDAKRSRYTQSTQISFGGWYNANEARPMTQEEYNALVNKMYN